MLGGVMAGLGHYLGIDVLWLRIIMVILFFGFGTGLFVYIVLWILVPEAITTTQKLEMKGEPITISNIEKKKKKRKVLTIYHRKLTIWIMKRLPIQQKMEQLELVQLLKM